MAQVLSIVPDGSREMIQRAQALYNAEKLDEAYTVVQDYLATEPNDAQALVLAATILKKAKRRRLRTRSRRRRRSFAPRGPRLGCVLVTAPSTYGCWTRR